MELRPVESNAESLKAASELLLICFPGVAKFSPEYLAWLYDRNPGGKVVGFDAWEGGQLAAHYVTVPATARVGGEDVRVLLSLNTATHPDHRGKGLFTKLADATYRAAAEAGYDAVYGVANAASTPGFVRKLEFQLVEPLLARVGFGGLGVDFDAVHARSAFRRTWSREALAWRCECPTNKVAVRPHGDGMALRAAGARGTTVWTEIGERHDLRTAGGGGGSPLRLFLGLLPNGVGGLRGFVNIPKRLRPSPLNFIYRSLSGRVGALETGSVFLNFADFDAY